jgi:hypothetical protein
MWPLLWPIDMGWPSPESRRRSVRDIYKSHLYYTPAPAADILRECRLVVCPPPVSLSPPPFLSRRPLPGVHKGGAR